MSWSLNTSRYHDMNKYRTLKLISPCNIEIPIDKSDYKYFIQKEEFEGLIQDAEDKICMMFTDTELKRRFKDKLHLSLLPDFENNTFFLGFSPKEVFNTIYEILGIKERCNMFYDSKASMNKSLNEVRNILSGYVNSLRANRAKLGTIINSSEYLKFADIMLRLDFAKRALNYVDYIGGLYYQRQIDKYVYMGTVPLEGSEFMLLVDDSHIKWRNLAQYIAYRSLEIYRSTNDYLYLEYPYKFYEKCTKPDKNGDQMKYVSELYFERILLDSKFKTFNKEMEDVLSNNPHRLEFLLHYRDNNRMTVLETLNPGNKIIRTEDFAPFMENKLNNCTKHKKKRDNALAESQFYSKIKFYSYESEFSDHVVCRLYERDDSDAGYVGFVLDNDYIVLDKFFDELKDGTCRPTLNAAVYALPLDLYVDLDKDISKILNYRLTVEEGKKKVSHKHHTKSENYTKELLEVSKRESISSLSATEFIFSNAGKTSKPDEFKIKRKKNKKSKKGNENKD